MTPVVITAVVCVPVLAVLLYWLSTPLPAERGWVEPESYYGVRVASNKRRGAGR